MFVSRVDAAQRLVLDAASHGYRTASLVAAVAGGEEKEAMTKEEEYAFLLMILWSPNWN